MSVGRSLPATLAPDVDSAKKREDICCHANGGRNGGVPMATFDARRLAVVLVLAVLPALLLTGCNGGGVNAGKTIVKFFAEHADELTGGAAVMKQKAISLVDDGLRDAEILAARNADSAAAQANSKTNDALTKVCNIIVDFSVPKSADSSDEDEVTSLVNAAESEFPGSGITSWSERLLNAYDAVWASGDVKEQARLTLARDAEVAAFQHAYCNR